MDLSQPMLKDFLALQKQSTFLSQLDEGDMAALAEAAEETYCAAGETLIHADDGGGQVFLLLEGRLIAEDIRHPTSAGAREEIQPGEIAGHVAFATRGVNESTVTAGENCRLSVLTRECFNQLLETRPDCWKKLEYLAVEQLRRLQLGRHLDRLFGPFNHLLPYVMQDINEDIEWMVLKSGETLYEASDPGEAVFILLTGRLLVTNLQDNGHEEILATVLNGEVVGEVAMLTEQNHTETVYATRDSDLVRLSKRGFGKMLQRNIWAVNRISRKMAQRVNKQRQPVGADRIPIRTISLLPASNSAPIREFLHDMAKVLAGHGNVKVLDSKEVDKALDIPGVAQALDDEPMHLRLTEWLHRQEEKHRYLLYQGDHSWTKWTGRCARQADCVAVVADADDMPDLAEYGKRLAGPRRHWSLVVVHPAGTDRPYGFARLLKESGAESIFHVRQNHAGDLARLARHLSGQAIGLVLGGGGARGFAHLGVLRALEELGIPVDMTAGTSIGSPIAFLNAADFNAAKATNIMATGFANLLDYTLPINSLLSGRRITNVIDHYCSPWDAEDLWKPWFCVSTNLTRNQPKVHRTGNVGRAIRASVAIPGVLPAVSENGEVLVDGGLLNNLPIDTMRESNLFGTVIAIDVVSPTGPKVKSRLSPAVSGWRLAVQKMLPWTKAPETMGLASIVTSSMVAGSGLARTRMLEQGLADFYFNIHVRGASMLDFDKVREIAEIGYQQSIGPLREWAEQRGLGNT